jgi:hypothetical protein
MMARSGRTVFNISNSVFVSDAVLISGKRLRCRNEGLFAPQLDLVECVRGIDYRIPVTLVAISA